MTIYPITIRGERRWKLDWTAGGKRRQLTFHTRQEAVAECDRLKRLAADGAVTVADMPAHDRTDTLAVLVEIQKGGLALRQVWEHWQRTATRTDVPTLDAAVEALIRAKSSAGRSPRYTESLRLLLKQFTRGMESKQVSTVTAEDVEAFMNRVALASRSTYRARLSTLFRFAVRRGWMRSNPCERLEPVRRVATPPAIMTPEQLQQALAWPNNSGTVSAPCGAITGRW